MSYGVGFQVKCINMSYEEEQADYRKQLMAVDERIKMLDELFEMQP